MTTNRPLTAVFSAGFLGGSELFNLEFLDTVLRAGISVRAVVPAHGTLQQALTARGIGVAVIPIPPALTSMSRFDDRVQAQKIPVRAWALAQYGRRLMRRLATTPGPLCALGFRAQLATAVASLPGKRTAWVVHEVVPAGPAALAWQLAARRSTRIVTYSRAAAQQPALRAANAEVHAVRFALGDYAEQPPPRSSPTRIGLVGDLVELKNHFALIDVVDRLRRRGVDATGVLVGRDMSSSLPRTAAYASRLRMAVEARGSAVSLKAVQPAEMPATINEFDILLHVSTVPESFGRVCVEAMAAGRPVVAFRHGAVGELVEDGRTGALCRVGDLDAVTDVVLALVEQPDRFALLSKEAKRTALTRYGPSGARDTVGDALAQFALTAMSRA